MSYPTASATPQRVLYDFRSDTVTRPTPAMLAAMAAAEVGDDVWGDDYTVQALEAETAELTGFEAGLFLPSGTQSNLVALMTHCQRGDEYLVGQLAHCYRWEGGGAAVLGSIQPQPLEHAADGSLPLDQLEAAIKPDDPHFARTRLLALENTIGGKVLPPAYVADALALARRHGLATHLDGARLWNAAAALGVAPAEVARGFDSVSLCLSKGLGAPVGSVLVGRKDFLSQARRWRKMLGGGMRQAGLLAEAGRHALRHHLPRIGEDHVNARLLAEGLSRFAALTVAPVQTNMLFVSVDPAIAADFAVYLRQQGVLISGVAQQRWVTHLDVDAAAIAATLRLVEAFFDPAKR
ncbi:low-specificity L-threonine aldolase [Chitinimonas lacunae]|uniref:Low-specificity L-threonine aldolase n=1 Tax=Chitinimonas lacunae TaxID=1963018 RepID=A0ABV8MS23_9NEIS